MATERSKSTTTSTAHENASPRDPRAQVEHDRLHEAETRHANWKRWGPYLADRQWATVREDYSADGSCWTYFPHDHARSRAYRWGEDGLLGLTDRQCRLCLAPALWNGNDPFLKERLFGLTNPQGNHGEDVKECYWHLDATPTASYCKALYRYPHAAFPYDELIQRNAQRGVTEPEFELEDTNVFNDNRYFDVLVEYAKASPNDILIRYTIANRGSEAHDLWLLPTLWFRNTWAWGRTGDGYTKAEPRLRRAGPTTIRAEHETLGVFELEFESMNGGSEILFTHNDTNMERIFSAPSSRASVKDAFHEYIVNDNTNAVAQDESGTKAAVVYKLNIKPGASHTCRLRLRATHDAQTPPFDHSFNQTFQQRITEANAYFDDRFPESMDDEARAIARAACAGLVWTKQSYHYVVGEWLEGDPAQPPPPRARRKGRNADWRHLFNRDVLSMPDGWEYPWYAAWDLAFHMLPFARLDPAFAKKQLLLLLREWYMHPNGQIPAYEFNFGDVNPPVHAWACWRVYKMTAPRGERDLTFLARAFQKLLINFTWWVNRKDVAGKHVFAGGFLGLDNIGVFDRSAPMPAGSRLEQADGTAWMAFYCGTMLSMALELAAHDPAYDDVASKFFEHFVAIADAMNTLGGTGLWNEEDGFYYDQIHMGDSVIPLKVRSMVGLLPLIAVETIEMESMRHLPGFAKRTKWFLENRPDLARHISYLESGDEHCAHEHLLLAIPSRDRLQRVLQRLLDETEFLSPFGVRSLSKFHATHPFEFKHDNQTFRVAYEPGESTSSLFGGNSNWRGPIWFPVNYLLIEALERYDHFYGDTLTIECPAGSGNRKRLRNVAHDLRRRLASLFRSNADADNRRPYLSASNKPDDPLLFHEYFHADTGRGLGAGHQTGWTALVALCMADLARGHA